MKKVLITGLQYPAGPTTQAKHVGFIKDVNAYMLERAECAKVKDGPLDQLDKVALAYLAGAEAQTEVDRSTNEVRMTIADPVVFGRTGGKWAARVRCRYAGSCKFANRNQKQEKELLWEHHLRKAGNGSYNQKKSK